MNFCTFKYLSAWSTGIFQANSFTLTHFNGGAGISSQAYQHFRKIFYLFVFQSQATN